MCAAEIPCRSEDTRVAVLLGLTWSQSEVLCCWEVEPEVSNERLASGSTCSLEQGKAELVMGCDWLARATVRLAARLAVIILDAIVCL